MKRRKVMLVLLGAACSVVVGLSAAASQRTAWTWTDGSVLDHRWDTESNWIGVAIPGYPDDANDHPLIPYDAGVRYWIIDLVDVPELGDMTIEGNVQFGDGEPNDLSTIICPNSLVIDGDNGEVEVSISDATISVDGDE